MKGHDSLVGYLAARHGLRVRRVPPEVMVGSMRRFDLHRKEILLDDEIDGASQNFQLALQLAYMEMGKDIDAVLHDGSFATETGGAADAPGARRLRRRGRADALYSLRQGGRGPPL